MTDPNSEKSLNLEALSFDELGRTPDCGNQPQEMADAPEIEVQPPGRRRRDPHKRELLGNQFPPEE